MGIAHEAVVHSKSVFNVQVWMHQVVCCAPSEPSSLSFCKIPQLLLHFVVNTLQNLEGPEAEA